MSQALDTSPAGVAAGGGLGLARAALLAGVGLAAGVGFALFAGPGPSKHEPKAEASVALEAQTAQHELPELIVNLADSQGQRYLKVRVAIVVRGAQLEQAKQRLQQGQAALRDLLIRLLSSKQIQEVESVEAKESIKLEILNLINQSMFPDAEATAEQLYFMEFLIQ
ncbi:MAG: flagellar basal body-associated FliL family protein [Planctomycetes bacterium]|nr:flagellar basal body-associated FliL family protein [Planctomycetota bacterium]